MKSTFFFFLLIFSAFSLSAQLVERSYGGPGLEFNNDLYPLEDGGYFLAGTTRSFSPGVNRAILYRADAAGNTLWSKVYDEYRSIVKILPRPEGGYIFWMQSADNSFAIGDDPVFIVELDEDANVLSSIEVLTCDLRVAMATSDGNYLLAGQISINTDGCGYVNKVSRTGEVLWTGCFGRDENDYAWRVYEDQDGNCIVGGISYRPDSFGSDAMLLKFAPDGTLLWERYQGYSPEGGDYAGGIVGRPNGNYLVAINVANEPTVLAEIDQNTGQTLQSIPLPNTGIQYGNILHAHPDGGYLITGSLKKHGENEFDGSIWRFDEDLNLLWDKQYGGPLMELSYHTHIKDDGYAILGVTRSFGSGDMDLYFILPDQEGNLSSGMLSGQLAYDSIPNCMIDSSELLLSQWLVEIQGFDGSTYAFTDENGYYAIPLEEGDYSTNPITPNSYWESCVEDAVVQVEENTSYQVDFPIQQVIACPFMESSVSPYFLEACRNGFLWVNYCNRGTVASDSSYITLTLDDLITVTASDIPWTLVDGNTYTFFLGNVGINACDRFRVNIDLSCDADDLQALLIESEVFPNELCTDPDPGYTGAYLEVSATCEDEEVIITISNTGDGPMGGPQDYVVIEDAVLLESMPLSLNLGESLEIPVAANGSTYYCAIPQEPGAPGGNLVSAVIEGCGTDEDGNFSTGLTNQFALSDANPFTTQSYFPSTTDFANTEVLSFPEGYGQDHLISNETSVSYVIPFSFVDPDTLGEVEIILNLSEQLDFNSLQISQASHPVKFNYGDDGELRLYCTDLSPDSTATSGLGYVGLTLDLKPNLANSTVVESSFQLQTDFNQIVELGAVYHTIGENFIIVAVEEQFINPTEIQVYPNPAVEDVIFNTSELFQTRSGQVHLQVYDQLGRLVSQQEELLSDQLRWQRGNLTTGIYQFVLRLENEVLLTGKLILQ